MEGKKEETPTKDAQAAPTATPRLRL